MPFLRLAKGEARQELARLVEAYRRQSAEVEAPGSRYTETEARGEFIDPLLAILGWDVHNGSGLSQAQREVVLERTREGDGNTTGRPDYRLRVRGQDRMPVEAKKPSVRLSMSAAAAVQARSYGWSLSLPASVLTNFAETVIFDSTIAPEDGDGPDVAVIPRCRFVHSEYVTCFDELWERLSYESVATDHFYGVYAYEEHPRGTSPFDQTFLARFRRWRHQVAEDIATRNPTLHAPEVGRRTQRLLNALLFVRVCEDRNIGRYEDLLRSAESQQVVGAFRRADRVFNAGMFDVLESTTVSAETLAAVIRELYWPKSKFAFGVLRPDILAAVYEQYLSERVVIVADRRVRLVEKPELAHAGGVVPTPDWVVGKLLDSALAARLTPDGVPADLSAWIHRLTLSDHFWVVFGVVDYGVWWRACEYCWSVQLFHCGVS
ncbi:MAG: hypothetical protein ACRDTH_09345, partial [Pseudonocardiaceae bacterium]